MICDIGCSLLFKDLKTWISMDSKFKKSLKSTEIDDGYGIRTRYNKVESLLVR